MPPPLLLIPSSTQFAKPSNSRCDPSCFSGLRISLSISRPSIMPTSAPNKPGQPHVLLQRRSSGGIGRSRQTPSSSSPSAPQQRLPQAHNSRPLRLTVDSHAAHEASFNHDTSLTSSHVTSRVGSLRAESAFVPLVPLLRGLTAGQTRDPSAGSRAGAATSGAPC